MVDTLWASAASLETLENDNGFDSRVFIISDPTPMIFKNPKLPNSFNCAVSVFCCNMTSLRYVKFLKLVCMNLLEDKNSVAHKVSSVWIFIIFSSFAHLL